MPVRRLPRWAAVAAGGAVLLVGAALVAGPLPAGTSDGAAGAAGPGGDYVVLYGKGAGGEAARSAVAAAGGRLLEENAAVGVGLVRADEHGFLRRAASQPALAGAARNQPIGRSPGRAGSGAARVPAAAPSTGAGGGSPGGSDPEPLGARQWDMAMIKATPAGAHAIETGRPDVLVGVVDTGIDAGHPDLAPNFAAALSRNFTEDIPLVDGPCEAEADRSCTDPVDVDENGHGTHVAATIAAAANGVGIAGVAPGVRLVNLRAGQDSGLFFLKPTVDAITWAADQGIDVVNLSFYTDPWLFNCRSNPADSADEQLQQATIIDATQQAVDYARARGVTVVAALGNGSVDLDHPTADGTSPDFPPGAARWRTVDDSCLTVPAELVGVLGVAAVGPSGLKAPYSNYGAGAADLAAPGGHQGDQPGPAAPWAGVEGRVLSAYPEGVLVEEGLVGPAGEPLGPEVVRDCGGGGCAYWRYLEGTSMAAPHVSGVAALVVSRFGTPDPLAGGLTLAPAEVEAILLATAADRPCPRLVAPALLAAPCAGDAARNSHYGEGLLDALAAVRPAGRSRPT